MRHNFAASLVLVLKHEGGFVNHPRDPGGATNKGITQAVYDIWRLRQGLGRRSVNAIETAEVEDIYRHSYWAAIHGDDLPSGLDYCVFDFAVNSGVRRAARYLQRVAGVPDDGKIGAITLATVTSKPAPELISAVCAARLAFLNALPTWPVFGRGWSRRVADVEAKARAMA